MAILQSAELLEHNIFVQGDARDPLGVWAIRMNITGDASGGTVKALFLAGQTNRVYTCTMLTLSGDGLAASAIGKFRLLTNFPPATPLGGSAGFSYNRVFTVTREPLITSPSDNWGSTGDDMGNSDTLLLFGPIPADPGPVAIVEMEVNSNVDGSSYFFEGWGYYWDKVAVLNAAGGPRFPGSN